MIRLFVFLGGNRLKQLYVSLDKVNGNMLYASHLEKYP